MVARFLRWLKSLLDRKQPDVPPSQQWELLPFDFRVDWFAESEFVVTPSSRSQWLGRMAHPLKTRRILKGEYHAD